MGHEECFPPDRISGPQGSEEVIRGSASHQHCDDGHKVSPEPRQHLSVQNLLERHPSPGVLWVLNLRR